MSALPPVRGAAGGRNQRNIIREQFQPLESRALPVIWLVRINLILLALLCFTLWARIEVGAANRTLRGAQMIGGLITILLNIVTAVFFLRWKYQAYTNLQVACEEPLDSSPRMILISYFIPLLNFFQPAIGMREILVRSKVSKGYLAYAWWFFWVFGSLVGQAILKNPGGKFDRVCSALIFVSTLSIIAGFMLLKIIKTVTEKQRRYWTALKPEQP